MDPGTRSFHMDVRSCRHVVRKSGSGELRVAVERRDLTGLSMQAPLGSHVSQPCERPIAVDGLLRLARSQGSTETCLEPSFSRRRPQWRVRTAPDCSPEGQAFVEFVNSTPIGLVMYDRTNMSAAAVIARLALAAPDAKIVVHGASRRQFRKLRRELQALSISAAAGGSPQAETAQVVCGTFAQLFNIPRRSNQPRIDVALDWQVALHARQHDQWLLDSDISRLFILAPLGDRFAPGDEDELRALVGFDEHRLAAAGRLPVDLGWAVLRHRQGWPEGDASCNLYWRNSIRNNHIARVARAFASGTHDHTEELSLAAASFISVLPNAPRVAVVVAQPQHGQELAFRLRVPCETGPGEQPISLRRRARSRPELRVVTSDRLLNLAAGDIDILIWAAGCRSVPSFSDEWWSTAADQPHHILWLDLSDEGRRDLAGWARQRIEGLGRWGGHPAGWDAAVDRCICWLESRNAGSR